MLHVLSEVSPMNCCTGLGTLRTFRDWLSTDSHWSNLLLTYRPFGCSMIDTHKGVRSCLGLEQVPWFGLGPEVSHSSRARAMTTTQRPLESLHVGDGIP